MCINNCDRRDSVYKRAEVPARELNSVPFMGKREEEEMLVRVPREQQEEEDGLSPWDLLDIPAQLDNNDLTM